jgi:hypothetical protein
MQRLFEFAAIPDTRYSLTPFLHRFDTIFTLNQDTLIEQKYLPGNISRRAHLPGLKFMNPSAMTGAVQDKFAMMEPNPSDFQLSPSIQPYIMLHDSVMVISLACSLNSIPKRRPTCSKYTSKAQRCTNTPRCSRIAHLLLETQAD